MNATTSLHSYIRSIKENTSSPCITSHSIINHSYIDQGISVEKYESIFRFEDGTIIKHLTETDSDLANNFDCAETWITYQVLFHPKKSLIEPQLKTFTNNCQEAFWLKIYDKQVTDI